MQLGFGRGFSFFPLRTFPHRHVVLFGAGFAGVKSAIVDYVVQTRMEGVPHEHVNWKRNKVFGLFGFCVRVVSAVGMPLCGHSRFPACNTVPWICAGVDVAPVLPQLLAVVTCLLRLQYLIYIPLFSRLMFKSIVPVRGVASPPIVPSSHDACCQFVMKPLAARLRDRRGLLTVGAQVVIDACVHAPLLYYPCFYALQSYVMTDGRRGWLGAGLTTWRANVVDDLRAYFPVWGPALAFNFVISPLWARIPFVALVSLGWSCVLSLMRGDLEAAA